MKRAWTKKVKAVPAHTAENNTRLGHSKSVQSKSKQRVRTSVAMVGLTISMGLPNILLTQQSDRAPAAEAVGNEPMFSTVPATMEVIAAASVNSVEPEATVSSPVVAPVHSQLQRQAKGSNTEDEFQKGQTPDLLPKNQTDVANTTQAVSSNSTNGQTEQFDSQAEAQSKPAQASVLVNALKDSGTGEDVSGAAQINRNQLTAQESDNQMPSAELAPASALGNVHANQASPTPMVSGTTAVTQPADLTLKGTAVKEERKASETVGSQAEYTNQVNTRPKASVATLGQKQAALLKLQEKPLTTAVVVPGVANSQAATLGQKQLALLSPQVDSVRNYQKLQETSLEGERLNAGPRLELDKTPVVADVPSAGKKPTAVAASSPEYQVKAGDTLTAIARNYGISVSELVNANGLTNPNQLQINQQIRVPIFQYSNTSGQTVAVIKGSRVTIAPVEIATSDLTVPVSPTAVSENSDPRAVRNWLLRSGRLTAGATTEEPFRRAATLETSTPDAAGTQTNAELVAHNSAESFQQEKLAPPPAADAAYTGVGGSILDEAVETTTVANPYFQNLQNDVQRLRQKYYAQVVHDRQLPMEEPELKTRSHATGAGANPPDPSEQRGFEAPSKVVTQNRSIAAPVEEQSPAQARVATAPMDMEPYRSLRSIVGTGEQQVSPDLPPLAPGDNYLPKPFDTSAPFKGYIWPTKGVLTSGYGWRWGRMHRGVDIAAPMGTPVFAAGTGVVIRAGWSSGGYGKVVDVQHADGSFTRYAHNKRILVQTGQQVQQGQQISEMGSTGFSTGPHCHFEVHPQGKGAVNPIAFLPGVKKLSRF